MKYITYTKVALNTSGNNSEIIAIAMEKRELYSGQFVQENTFYHYPESEIDSFQTYNIHGFQKQPGNTLYNIRKFYN